MALSVIPHRLVKILDRFPSSLSAAFAYGSGVFQQAGREINKDTMVDFLLVVKDTKEWHRENMRQNPRDYSWLSCGGVRFISYLQEHGGAHMYFNTLIPYEDILIKYGVISRDAAIADLLDWDQLYFSGRLHKPVCVLQSPLNPNFRSALKVNLRSALHTALLLLPQKFSEKNLYEVLAGLSYLGDFRMHVGEDKNKVSNIVVKQMEQFRELYRPSVASLSHVMDLDEVNGVVQDVSPTARHLHLTMLPKTLQLNFVKEWNRDGRHRDVEDVLRAAAHAYYSSDIIERGIQSIVLRSSVTQSMKGILTAGVWKSAKYSTKKLQKMIKSMKS